MKNAAVTALRLVCTRDSDAPWLHRTTVDLIGITVDGVRVCRFDTGAAATEDPKLSEVARDMKADVMTTEQEIPTLPPLGLP